MEKQRRGDKASQGTERENGAGHYRGRTIGAFSAFVFHAEGGCLRRKTAR